MTLATIVSAVLLGVNLLLDEPVARWTMPLVVAALIVTMGVGWPRLNEPTRRRALSGIVSLAGLLAVVIVAVLPEGTVFVSEIDGFQRPDLWLAPLAGVLAAGVILTFIVQLWIGPEKQDRPAATAGAIAGAGVAVAGAGWVLLAREDLQRVTDAGGVTAGSGVLQGGISWVGLVVLTGVIIAALLSLIPIKGMLQSLLVIGGALAITIALHAVNPQPVGPTAVVTAGIAALLVQLFHKIARVEEPETASAHPTAAVAMGVAPVLATGMATYLALWLLPSVGAL